MIRFQIPFDFIRLRARLTWNEILFGLVEELLEPSAPIAFAEAELERGVTDPVVVELAALSRDESNRALVESLAAGEGSSSDHEVRAKWLCLVLAWAYEHRDQLADPLGTVELIYAEFDYPEPVASFVRYMPADEPTPASPELALERLLENWRRFIEECQRTYAPDEPRPRA